MFTFFETNTLSRKAKLAAKLQADVLEIKSKFDAEFRRFSIDLSRKPRLEDFYNLVSQVHNLQKIPFFLTYTDPEGDLLPINNEDNFARALSISKPLLKLIVQHQGNNQLEANGYISSHHRRNIISRILDGEIATTRTQTVPQKAIGMPKNFRCVSAIIDFDVLPETQRRVKLIRSSQDIPLGFFIRDGYNINTYPTGQVEKVYGIFISKLLPKGLAASTGLLAVNDEIIEVNGIEVVGKTLDQVTDMMIANSSNLIITIKPCNQYLNVATPDESEMLRESLSKNNNNTNDVSPSMTADEQHKTNDPNDDDDNDYVKEFVRQNPSGSSNADVTTRFQNNLSIRNSSEHQSLKGRNKNNNDLTFRDSDSFRGKSKDQSNLSKQSSNLNFSTKSGSQVIRDLQSLNNLNADEEKLRFVEGDQHFSVNDDCNNFLSMKSNDFYNFTNSSLRMHNKPSSTRETNGRISSLYVNHRSLPHRK